MAENQDRSLIVSMDDDVVTLKLNRPQVRNAVNFGLLQDLEHALDSLYEAPPRVIVLTATPPGFCAGIDLKESREASADFARVRVSTMHRVLRKLRIIPVPVISAIDGVTAGLGTELMISGDLRFATAGSRFSYPEPRVAVPSPAHRLVSLIGLSRAQDMLLTARWVEPDEAERIGLITRQVGALDVAVQETIETLRGLSPLALAMTKENLWASVQDGAEASTAHHIAAVTLSASTNDRHEALAAFSEKRAPRFTGS